MQRLVYSPKVQAFVRTESDGIVDVSDFIVSGSVNRVVNEVSTAELVLRNPGKRFTQPGNPTFRPMDGITIFARRYADRPVQLFTGYLDSTPYLQLLPGTCTITASCTLKRLLYTYWDAGLAYTQQFLSQFGWQANLESGQIFNPAAQGQNSGLKPGEDASQADIENALITDGSIGNLLWNVLNQVGNWDDKQILIEQLPTGIIETVADISTSFEQQDEEVRKEFEDVLSDLIGNYSGGAAPGSAIPGSGPGGAGTDGTGVGANPASKTIVTPEQVGLEMLYAGFPADPKVIASGIETVEGESDFGRGNAADGWGLNDYGCCAGYWQIYLSVHGVSMECANNLRCSTKFALSLWKGSNCFACLSGPNPWQGGTDNGTKYLSLAQKLIEQAEGKSQESQTRPGQNTD